MFISATAERFQAQIKRPVSRPGSVVPSKLITHRQCDRVALEMSCRQRSGQKLLVVIVVPPGGSPRQPLCEIQVEPDGGLVVVEAERAKNRRIPQSGRSAAVSGPRSSRSRFLVMDVTGDLTLGRSSVSIRENARSETIPGTHLVLPFFGAVRYSIDLPMTAVL
jgi:hypothetical protein